MKKLSFALILFAMKPASAEINADQISCSSMMAPGLKEAYREKDLYQTPVFDQKTDEDILAAFSKIDPEVIKEPKAEDVLAFANIAYPVFEKNLKAEVELCHSITALHLAVCDKKMSQEKCNEVVFSRADGKLLLDNLRSGLRQKVLRPKVGSTTPNYISPWYVSHYPIVIGFSWVLVFLVFFYLAKRPQKFCPNCNEPLPKFKVPNDVYELFAGGWTCQKCGTKLTARLKKRF